MAKYFLILENLDSAASPETVAETVVCLKIRPKPFAKINNLMETMAGEHTNKFKQLLAVQENGDTLHTFFFYVFVNKTCDKVICDM